LRSAQSAHTVLRSGPFSKIQCYFGRWELRGIATKRSHTVFAVKWAFLIEVTLNAIGILAVLTGAASWLELRLEGRERRVAAVVWPICLTLVGVVLFVYRETVFQ